MNDKMKQLEGEVRRLKSLLHQLFNLKTYHPAGNVVGQPEYLKSAVYERDKSLYREIEEELAK